jgi:uncharacterized protein (DUF488 family)
MKETTIFSIGHGNKSIETFIEELKSFNIEFVFDVRSKPFSKFHSHFNKALLEIHLIDNSIGYEFLGEYLGGLPDDISCYVSGKVNYDLVKTKPYFRAGIDLLVEANNEDMRIAIMCSESKPEECHRSKLIGEELLKYGVSLKHIILPEKIREQKEVMDILTKGKNLSNLFGDNANLTSKKKY